MSLNRIRVLGLLLFIALSAWGVVLAPTASAECRSVTREVRTTKTVATPRGAKTISVKTTKTFRECDEPRDPGSSSGERNSALPTNEIRKRWKTWEAHLLSWQKCQANEALLPLAPCGNSPGRPDLPDGYLTFTNPAPQQITVTPEQAAYMAVAELRLTAPTPGIGPSPKINPWKIAAVGYPYWLWADGNTNPAPVTDTVADLTVSLDAHISKIVFHMGDGNTVTCRGLGTKWHRNVEPGSPSPTCGYRWSTPSLPRGKYTVTAKTYWAVDWQANGQRGTIPIIQQASTQIPVGELQVTIR